MQLLRPLAGGEAAIVTELGGSALLDVAEAHVADLGGGLKVKRALPHARRRSVGPFVFLDHFGPHRFPPLGGMDVRPHPHIGLATITWLFTGAVMHRDSLGCVQRIEPGEVNWMTAGGGIVHSERTPMDLRPQGSEVHGLQFWVGLPLEHEEVEPSFQHVGKADLAQVSMGDARGTLVVGSTLGAISPVRVYSPLVLAVFTLAAGGTAAIPSVAPERAIYIVSGRLSVAGASASSEVFGSGSLVLLREGVEARIRAHDALSFALIGGTPIGPRMLYWNFVSSGRERIERAKADWAAGRFPPVPGETEFIPLPER